MYSLIASEDPEEKYKGIIQAGNIVNGRVIIISCVLTRVKMLRQKARSYDIGIRVSTDRVPGNAAGVAGALEIFMHSADDDEICIPMNQNIGIKMWSPMRQAFGGLNENKINLNAMRGARLQEVSFVPKDRDGFVEFLGFLRAVQDDLTGRQSKLTDMMKPAEHLKVKTS